MHSRIKDMVSKLIDRELTMREAILLGEFTNTNLKLLKNDGEVQQVAKIAEEFIDILEGKNKPEDFNLTSTLGMDTISDFIKKINPEAKTKKAYMCLDSRYAEFNNACTKLTWSFTNDSYDVYNSTNVLNPIRNIVSIRMHSIVVRKFDSIPKRATIAIEELGSQAFIMGNGRRFHFFGLLNDVQLPVGPDTRNALSTGFYPNEFASYMKYELLSGYKFNDGIYKFNKPVTLLDKITISIGNPDELVIIPRYEFKNITVSNVTITYIDITCESEHFYQNYNNIDLDGYSVFLDGFSSSDSTFDNVINSYDFTKIEIISPTIVRLYYTQYIAGVQVNYSDPALTFFVPAGPWTATGMRFNSYRVIMNFELEFLK